MNSITETLPDATPAQAAKLAMLFADVECPYLPCGEWVCLQEPVLPEVTPGGVLLPEMVAEVNRLKNMVGRVHVIGPLCGKSVITEQNVSDWPHYYPGDFVRVSPHSHTRMDAEGPGGPKSVAYFRLVAWRDIMAVFIAPHEILRTLRQ
jgi:hypothetical protein